MINKVLIANRGEIVRRVERASGDLGLRTVAVYSDADAGASYVRQAEEAVRIGEANPVKSYLNIGALVEAIRQSGADAVHPGYGFLSENASFAEAVERVGCIWVGPPALVLRAIESKCYCRDIATSVGVPVVPGSTRVLRTVDEVRSAARGLNYPILLKLDRGGGGKGIEKVERAEQVDEVFARVQRIGAMAFGSPDVYVEQAIMEPRHIEVQFIADREGNVVCLGERECSIQRRHQKIIEESPSPVVSPVQRRQLTEYATKLAQGMGYVGAGTMEFLRSGTGNFYFMEVNARLQVEHPVSEFVTGCDIVQWQLRIADGERLSFSQADIELMGHSIEARCYAEEPGSFRPSPGTVKSVHFPTSGRHLRVDHALEVGGVVPPYYDPLIAKVISWDTTREQAIDRLLEGLSEFAIEGFANSIPVNLLILQSAAYRSGDLSTAFLARLFEQEVDWAAHTPKKLSRSQSESPA
jgi:acetyl-CoA carboxylase biotin carboxylase subunit